jgi:hypothetical protein
METAVLIT